MTSRKTWEGLQPALARMEATEMNRKLIGKHLHSPEAHAADFSGEWPIIDSAGIITGSYDGDCVPDGATLVDWNSNNPDNSGYTVVSGDNGFEAVLE